MSSNKDDQDKKNQDKKGLSGLVIAGIVIGSISLILLIAYAYSRYRTAEYISMLKEDVSSASYPRVFQRQGSLSLSPQNESIHLSRTLSRPSMSMSMSMSR